MDFRGHSQNIVNSIVELYNVTFFTFHKTTSEEKDVFIATNYDHEWESRYTKKRYQSSDYAVTNIKREFLPFFWGKDLVKQLDKKPKQVFIEARDFNINEGVTIPFSEKGRAVSLATNQDTLSAEVRDHIPDLFYVLNFLCEMESLLSLGHFDKVRSLEEYLFENIFSRANRWMRDQKLMKDAFMEIQCSRLLLNNMRSCEGKEMLHHQLKKASSQIDLLVRESL